MELLRNELVLVLPTKVDDVLEMNLGGAEIMVAGTTDDSHLKHMAWVLFFRPKVEKSKTLTIEYHI